MPVARRFCCLTLVFWSFTVALHADPDAAATDSTAAKKGFFERDSPLPDPAGLRAKLADKGITLGLIYTGEVFGNPAGGYRQGTVYDGLLTGGLDVDFGKLAGWQGLKFHALAYETHGPSGTNVYTRDLNRFSNIDAYDSVRLFECWVQTSFFDNVVNFRIGQLAVDAEFVTTIGGALFINPNFGAFPLLSLNVPEPIYPEAAPGARLRLNAPNGHFYFQTGVYSGNPNADRDGDPNPGFRAGTAYNDNGIRFPISGNQGLLSISEAGYLRNYRKSDPGLPGVYRIGAFYHTGTFSDKRFDASGRSLADPLSTGIPRGRNGNAGFFAVAEQVVYRPRNPTGGNEDVAASASAPIGNAEDSPISADGAPTPSGPQIRLFGRLGIGEGDRSLTDFYVEAGFNYRAIIPGRDGDLLGVGFTYTDLSADLRQFVNAENRFNGTHVALPDYAGVLEVTYQANLAPWLSVQPDLQYIVHPDGSGRYGNALVLGVRTVITF